MHMRAISILLLFLVSIAAFGQSDKKRKKQKKADQQSVQTPTSLDPNLPQEKYEPKRSRSKKSSGPTYNNEQEYYERLAALEKTRRKNERMQEKPQYSDPAYFGHKRPPKRRPPGKMKYCKVCCIRH